MSVVPVVLFDGRCRVCSGLARWLRARPGMRDARMIPNQAPGAAESFGLSRRQIDQEIWFIDAAGRRLAGADAVNAILRRLGRPWSLAAAAAGIRPLARLEAAAYAWFSRNRGRFAFLVAGPPEWPEPAEAGQPAGKAEACGCEGRLPAAPRLRGIGSMAALAAAMLALAAAPPVARRIREISRRARPSRARRRGNPRWLP
jgi:predicted DCC family thiol-disulfide oxidoreductase YuxK